VALSPPQPREAGWCGRLAYGHPAGAPPGETTIDAVNHRPRIGWTRRDTITLIALTLAAAALRFVALGRPVELVFDEIFYARDACWYVAGSEAVCNVGGLVSRAHPPLGKWLIGAGIAAFGYDPFGWRVAVAAASHVSPIANR
jgi:dolichyl-phosphate-mannose--protein O-mannosyl transferase